LFSSGEAKWISSRSQYPALPPPHPTLELQNSKHLCSRGITQHAISSMCAWAAARQGNCMLYMSSLSIFGSLYDYCKDLTVFPC